MCRYVYDYVVSRTSSPDKVGCHGRQKGNLFSTSWELVTVKPLKKEWRFKEVSLAILMVKFELSAGEGKGMFLYNSIKEVRR